MSDKQCLFYMVIEAHKALLIVLQSSISADTIL